MVVDSPLNVSNVVAGLPTELVGKIGLLINILQALGIFIIAYLIFNVVNTVINRRRNKKIDQVVDSVEEMKNILLRQENLMKKFGNKK